MEENGIRIHYSQNRYRYHNKFEFKVCARINKNLDQDTTGQAPELPLF
jgi:hypothetical protein